MDHSSTINTLLDGTSKYFQLLAFQADQSINDNFHYGKNMKAEDAEYFKVSTIKEFNSLHEADVYDAIPLSDNPKDRKLIKFIWSFRRKRSLIGELIKYESRSCVHGGMQ